MKISLRKANAIQKVIQEEITGLNLSTDVQISEFDNSLEKVTLAQQQFFANMEKRSDLLDALYGIRAAVSGVNGSNGVNGILTILAQNEKDIALYGKLSRLSEQTEFGVINGKIAKIRDRKEDLYGRDDIVNTSIFNKATLDTFKSKLSSLKKEKQKLQDELLELNVRTEIMLSDMTIKTLQSVNIL